MTENIEAAGYGLADDRSLAARAKNGDGEAFAKLVRAHHGCMRRVAQSCGLGPADVETAIRNTWVAAVSRLDEVTASAVPRVWVLKTLLTQIDLVPTADVRHPPSVELPSDEGEETILASVERAIEAIPRREALVLEMRDIAGLTSAQVQGVMGVGAAEQRELLGRARRRVAQALNQP
jgi:DNA-directed RNA polymerase specialized sigma24 family protein